MDYAKLQAELINDPLNRGYADMNDTERAASLNAPTRTTLRPLTMKELREWAAEGTRAIDIHNAITDETKPPQVRNICLVADKLLGTDEGSLEPGNDAHLALINGLVSAGIITAPDRTALAVKASDPCSRAQELGIDPPDDKHVHDAYLVEVV